MGCYTFFARKKHTQARPTMCCAANCLYHTELPTCMPCKHRPLPTADTLTPSIF